MLKPLASAIHNYSDLSYITKKGVKEKCLCGLKIIQLLRKWSLVLMKQCGNLDPLHLSHVIRRVSHSGVGARQGQRGRL